MTDSTPKSSRRSFFLQGGAVLGAGVATGAAALMSTSKATSARQPGQLEDREAIRQLHLTFTILMENQAYEAAAELFDEQAHLDLGGLCATGKAAIANLFAQQYCQQQVAALHSAYRQSSTQRNDVVILSNDRRQATATFHTEVQISTPLQGDSTAAQMARLQGQMVDRHWESGRFEAQYVKAQGLWKMASLSYSPT
jgi:hypothetical protein